MTAAVGFAVGLLLGLIHFGTLWVTVRRMPDAARPGLLFAASFAVRIAVLVGGLLIVAHDWRSLLSALLGLLVARTALTHRIGRIRGTGTPATRAAEERGAT